MHKELRYHSLTSQKNAAVRKSWIRAIRRDPGKDFELTGCTKVCSRHFKPADIKKSLNGIVTLNASSVPSIFAWTVSPREKKSLTKRQRPSTSTTTVV